MNWRDRRATGAASDELAQPTKLFEDLRDKPVVEMWESMFERKIAS